MSTTTKAKVKSEWADKPSTIKHLVAFTPSKEARIVIKFGSSNIDSKVRIGGVGGDPRFGRYRGFGSGYMAGRHNVRYDTRVVKRNGRPMTIPLQVKTTFIECTIGEKTIKARSCCKPPDFWSTKTGIYYAVRHLFRIDSKADKPILSKKDRATLMQALCPWLFNKAKKKKTAIE